MRLLLFVLLGLLVCSIATAKKSKAKHKKAHAKSGGIASEKVEGKAPKSGKKAVGKDKGKNQQFIPPPPPPPVPPPPPPPGTVPTPGPPPPAPPPCDGGVWNPATNMWDCPAPPAAEPFPPPLPYPPPPPEYPPPPPPPPPVPPPPPPYKFGKDEEGSGEEEKESESVSATKEKENDKTMLKGKKSKKNDGKASHKTSRRHMKKAGEEKRGTVLTHTINKISQTPNAKLLQHGKSHTTSTSHLKQGARKKRSELLDFDLTEQLVEMKDVDTEEKRGTVLTHTINKISQTPNAKVLQHGKSHTTSTSHLKQDSRKRMLHKLSRKSEKKGKVIQHTISKVSQSPSAENAMHGISHTVSKAHATKTEGVHSI